MSDASKLIEGIIAENTEMKTQVESLISKNEKLEVELSVLKDRLKELEPYAIFDQKIPDVCTFTVKRDTAKKVYSMAYNIWGAKANPYKGSEELKAQALKKIDYVVENMIAFITSSKQRAYEFMKASNLAVSEDNGKT